MTDVQLSDTEVKAIISGIEANVRTDGRTRVQHRPLEIELNPVPHACGSCQVSFSSGGDGEETKILVSIMADVVEVADAEDASCQRGSMEIHLDCVPTVMMLYGKLYSGGVSLRSTFGASNRGRMTFLTHSTMSLSKLFGAKVSLSGSTLSAGGDVDMTTADFGADDAAGSLSDDAPTSSGAASAAVERSCNSFYKDLYIGNGFAYELHADVNVLQGGGGNLLTAASAGILAALKCMQLPKAEVTVHSDGSASVEVHPKQTRVGAAVRLHEVPILVTSCLHKGFYVVDPTFSEEIAIPSNITIGVTDQKLITNVTQTAHTGRRLFPTGSTIANPEDLMAILSDVTEIASELLDSIDRRVRETSERAEATGAAARGTAVAAIKN